MQAKEEELTLLRDKSMKLQVQVDKAEADQRAIAPLTRIMLDYASLLALDRV